MQHFADICLAYGKAVGLGKENMNEIQPFIAALKRLYPKIAIKGNCRLQIYECLINISEDRLKYLLSFPWQKDPHRKLSRLLNNHVPQHRARIALLRKDFETSKTILDELFDKLIKIPKQNKPTLLVEQVFPLLADWHIVQEKFTELRTYINRINKSFRNSSTTVESAYIKYVRMWEKYVHSRIGTAMIDENDEFFQELENTFQREKHHWNYALLMKLWGESTLSGSKLLESQNEYERIGSNLDAALVKAQIIRISQTGTL
ncbi:hypothetical protein BKA69DRAFT_1105851 [Paraphysoderma sedebokerense]|nr:hypothetical protein BKA69DRAFT_1105851 [Paraphysoderma sedebokerense]